MHRHELTEVQWQKIEPLIRRHGRTAKLGDRSFVNAVIYVLKTGTPWRDLPERFGNWKSAYNRFANWTRAGDWERIFKALQLRVDRTGSLVDATIAQAPSRRSRRKRGPECNQLGRSRGGFATKIHALVDGKGRPVHLELTPGQQHEAAVAEILIEHAVGKALIGDAGYDSAAIRAKAKAQGMRVVIPSNPTRSVIHRYDKKLYGIRYRIEVFFHLGAAGESRLATRRQPRTT